MIKWLIPSVVVYVAILVAAWLSWGNEPADLQGVGGLASALAGLGLLVGVGVAVSALKDTRALIENSERAWLHGIRFDFIEGVARPGSSIGDAFHLHFQNIGKLPARNTHFDYALSRDKPLEKGDMFVADQGKVLGIVFPGEPSVVAISFESKSGTYFEWKRDELNLKLSVVIRYETQGKQRSTVVEGEARWVGGTYQVSSRNVQAD